MNRTMAAGIRPGAVSGGMLWLVGAAFALTQLTSLTLGPAVSRQLHLSLSVPAVEPEDAPGLVGPGVDTVLGAVSTAVPAKATATGVVSSRRVASPAASKPPVGGATLVIKNEPAAARTRGRRSGHDDNGVERRVGKVAAQD